MGYDPRMYFPQTYQPQMYQQMPMAQTPVQMPGMQQSQQQTKYVEVIPVDLEKEALDCPMAPGTSNLFFARNDSFIAVKNVGVNGQIEFDVYDKRPPAPVEPPFDPAAYVRRDELPGLIASAMAAQKGKKKEAADNEPV